MTVRKEGGAIVESKAYPGAKYIDCEGRAQASERVRRAAEKRCHRCREEIGYKGHYHVVNGEVYCVPCTKTI